MSQFQPRRIMGKWTQGYALDLHTISSIPIGHNEYGHTQFDTTRSEIGELLFRLKFRADKSTVPLLVSDAVDFLRRWDPAIDMIVPVPPSGTRAVQPVILLAEGIGAALPLPLMHAVTKTRDTPQLKNIFDLDARLAALEGAHAVDPGMTRGRKILLFDDLFRSGATMSAIATALYEQGGAAEVFALTMTRTRSHQ